MSAAILALGTAVPATTLTCAEAEGVARALCGSPRRAAWLASLYAGAGIDVRHLSIGRDVVDAVLSGSAEPRSAFLPSGAPDDAGPTTAFRMAEYARHAAPLALAAARIALDRAGVPAERVSHVVTASCPGFQAPGVDVALIQGLGLRRDVERTNVGFMGCHAALNALRVARSFVEADPAALVLVAAVELCSLHYHYGWDLPRIVANSLFADGAAAAVCAPDASAPPDAWRIAASGSCLVPDSEDAMTWTIGDHGFAMTLSKRIPDLIATSLRPWLEAWLGRHGTRLVEVRSWAVHPGGVKIVDAVETSLDLPAAATAASRAILAENGNMSSPTILFILERLRAESAPRPCVALGFGPGLTVEAALLR